MGDWDFCTPRDGRAGIFTEWNLDFLAIPPACFFQVFVSAIPNIFFIILFLRKIIRFKTSVDFSRKEDDNEQVFYNPTFQPSISIDINDNSTRVAETSSLLLLPSSSNKTAAIKRFQFFLRYCAYIQCSLFFLFLFIFYGDASDFTSGLFVYILNSTVAWTLCGVCMDIDLNHKERLKFTCWPGNLAEIFFYVNMVANGITCVSTEIGSYENAQSGAVIIVVGGLISIINSALYGLCLLQESRFCPFLFQDDVDDDANLPRVGVLMRPILKTFTAEVSLDDGTYSSNSTSYHLEQSSNLDVTTGLLSYPTNPMFSKSNTFM